LAGLVSRLPILKVAVAHFSKKSLASSKVPNFLGRLAFKTLPSPRSNSATTLKDDSGLNFSISRSRSTISLTATDCTLPADSPPLILVHKTGEISKPTNLSRILRACWAFTRSISMVRGWSMAFKMAFLVISLKNDPPGVLVIEGQSFFQVPGYGLSFTVVVSGQPDRFGAFCQLFQF
jgi:hypothetical protein